MFVDSFLGSSSTASHTREFLFGNLRLLLPVGGLVFGEPEISETLETSRIVRLVLVLNGTLAAIVPQLGQAGRLRPATDRRVLAEMGRTWRTRRPWGRPKNV